jgi:hypothetical protein
LERLCEERERKRERGDGVWKLGREEKRGGERGRSSRSE